MKKLFILIVGMLMYFQGMSHDPAFSVFHLSNDKSIWSLRAEFPWSIRNALVNVYPFLEVKGTSQEMFEDCLLEYIDDKLEINIDGQILFIDQFYQIPGDHGHSYIYVFEMEGPTSAKNISINNSCMQELYKKQRNQIIVLQGGKTESCVATRLSPSCNFIL